MEIILIQPFIFYFDFKYESLKLCILMNYKILINIVMNILLDSFANIMLTL